MRLAAVVAIITAVIITSALSMIILVAKHKVEILNAVRHQTMVPILVTFAMEDIAQIIQTAPLAAVVIMLALPTTLLA